MTASALAPNVPNIIDTVANLIAFDGNVIPNGTLVQVLNSNTGGPDQSSVARNFKFVTGSVVTDASAKWVLAPNVNPAGGKWITVDPFFELASFVQFTQADASALWTIPTGFRCRILRPFFEVGTAWTGGAASSIGLSSSNAAYNTKGDLMGGAAGDIAANLAAGFKGTAGAKIAAMYATLPPVILIAGDTIRWDRITSAFTAGTGIVHCPIEIVP